MLAKNEADRERLGTVLYNLLEVIRWGAVMLKPFIPASAEGILNDLGTSLTSFDTIGSEDKFGGLKAGDVLADSRVLFARIDEQKKLSELAAEMEAQKKAAQAMEKPEGCATIGFDTFMGVELRTAKVLSCEKVPKAKKLLCMQLDLGYEKRQVVSGIAAFYKPEDMVGKKVIVVANLAPAKLCGIESQGMILASGEEEVRVVFLSDDTPLGQRVR